MSIPNLILTSSFNTIAKKLFDNALLPKHALVAFIPTASNPYTEHPWVEKDREALVGLGYEVTDVDLENRNEEELKKDLASADIIFVAGGNTTYLTEQSHRSGLHNIIRSLLHQGKMYIGSSAGSLLAGPSAEPFVEEDSVELPAGFVLSDPTCFGLVDYIVLPHYPLHAKENDSVMETYGDKFHYVKMTDVDYRMEMI
ncbi:MAG: Type 1 glutamine amidotransferase-like domain-containing protein [Candidatus Uhrbacteria bacterium]|nr:Type 1 glutamine amidotransferase-like domain-containing protein [Candidatus Uhrbacteria bacterium]